MSDGNVQMVYASPGYFSRTPRSYALYEGINGEVFGEENTGRGDLPTVFFRPDVERITLI